MKKNIVELKKHMKTIFVKVSNQSLIHLHKINHQAWSISLATFLTLLDEQTTHLRTWRKSDRIDNIWTIHSNSWRKHEKTISRSPS